MSSDKTGTDTSTSSPSTGAGESALSMLADLESRVSGLKKLHEQLASKEREVLAQAADITMRETRAAADALEAQERKAELDRMRLEVEARSRSLAEREAEIDARRGQVESEDRKLQDAREELDRQRKSMEEAHQRAEAAARTRAEQDQRACEELSSRLGERERHIAEWESSFAGREKEVHEQQQRFASIEAELDQRESRAAEREQAVAGKEQWLAERERVAAERTRQADQDATRNEKTAKELEDKLEAFKKQDQDLAQRLALVEKKEHATAEAERMVMELAEREKELAQLTDRLNAQETRLKEQEAQLERDKAAVAEQQRTLAARSEDAESQGAAIFAGRSEQLQLELGEAKAAKAALETELAQSRARIQELTDEVRSVVEGTSSAGDELKKRDARIAELEAEHKKLESAGSDAARKLEQSRAEALAAKAAHDLAVEENSRALESEVSTRDNRIAEHEVSLRKAAEELDALQRTIAELRERAERAEAGVATSKSGDAIQPEELEKRDHAISLLKDRLERTQAEHASMTARLAKAEARAAEAEAAALEAQTAPAPASHEPDTETDVATHDVIHSLQRRQQRLRSYKSLLQTQARKIVAAQSALQKRHVDCEQILAQRTRLAQVAGDLSRREKRAASTKARSTAGAALLYLVATLGIVAVLSWEIAKRSWPGTYVARATIEADARGHKPTPELLAAWQQDQEALLRDPRLMEFAAERFSRRGLPALASPAELKDRLNKDMYVQSPQPGTMTIELRGTGGERTALELDTLVTAVKSMADMAREERGNNLGLAIAQPATAMQEPIAEQRLQYAAMVFGVGAVGSLALGAGLWWRLSSSKKTFDHAQAVEAALDGVDWASLEKTFRKPARDDDGSSRKAA